jgi:addiction module HigA family antidote
MSDTPAHPGRALAQRLEARGVTPAELARQIEVPANRISQIINGKRAISGDTALRLAHWFDTKPEYWLHLQAAYDLHIARESTGHVIAGLPTLGTSQRPPRRRRPHPAKTAASERRQG